MNERTTAADASQHLTLKRLLVWLLEPQERLKTLAFLVDACRGTEWLSMLLDRPLLTSYVLAS